MPDRGPSYTDAYPRRHVAKKDGPQGMNIPNIFPLFTLLFDSILLIYYY